MSVEDSKFDSEFQLTLFALILKDKHVVERLRHFRELPQTFEDDLSQGCVQIALDFYDKYQNIPTYKQLLIELEKKGFLNVQKAIRTAIDLPVDNPDWYVDSIEEYLYHNALSQHIFRINEALDSGDLTKAETLLQKASKLKKPTGETGLNFFENIDHEYLESTLKVTTGIDPLNKCLDGGLGIGELGLVMGPPASGKSMTLCYFGAQAVIHKYNVLHFTFELSGERTMMRYESSFTNIPTNELRHRKGEVVRRLSKLKRVYGFENNLYISGYPTKSTTVPALKSYIEQLMDRGFKPDLIIVDYLDLIKWSSGLEKRDGLGENTEGLRNIAGTYKVPVWSGTQANRASIDKIVFGMENISESFEKAMITDVILTICQTKDEFQANVLRYYIAKNRNNPAGAEIEAQYCFSEVNMNLASQRI